MNNSYEDIINLPHHVSEKHPQMPLSDRAAQFAPFAALTGHDAAIAETARLTSERIDLGDDAKTELDIKLNYLRDFVSFKPEISVTYFKPDSRKSGGSYLTVTGQLKNIDDIERIISLTGGINISADEIIAIDSEVFADMF